jgi:membrane protease YdiL (CAAX protease family)
MRENATVPVWAFVIPIALVVLAEGILFFGRPSYALPVHLLNLLFCALIPIRHRVTLPLLQPFALLPLFRLVNLGMPTFFELTVLFFPFIYLPLLPALVLVARSQEIPIRTNLKGLLLIPVVVALAAPIAVAEYAILEPESLIPAPTPGWLIAMVLIQVLMVGLVEEILFRGILQHRFAEYLGRPGGIALASALFGAMHSIYGSGLEIVYVVFVGAIFGVIYELTDSIGLVSILHGALNVFLFALIPIYRPGIVQEVMDAVLSSL